jgi:CheY-like chemotaxis protein
MGAARRKKAPAKLDDVPCVAVVLEDERDQRDSLVALVTALGVPCVACSNLSEALLEVGAHPLALVLLDRHLPDGDGYEIARALRTRPCGRSVPIVALSAAVQRGDVEAALLAGCDAFLGKPCTAAALVATLEKLLHRPGSAAAAARTA